MTETMDDFKDAIDHSFRKMRVGDIVTATVIGVSDTEVTVDLGTYTDGVVPLEECSNDPQFSIKKDIEVGASISVMVIQRENENGSIVLSLKRANDILVWENLEKAMEERQVFSVKLTQAVPSGVVGYVKGIRAFLPASQLSLSYVENVEEWVGRTVDAIIITADAEKQKLVLSAKEILKEKAVLEKNGRLSRLVPGTILEGTIERMESYGVFVNIGEGLTGLVHISQITDRFIKSPKEVVKLGDKVKVKILGINGDRISLSMKQAEEILPEEHGEEEVFEYQSEGEASTSLGDLLKGIKL